MLTRFGGLLRSPASPNMKFFARPALNLDTSRVLLVSLESAKPRTAPQGEAVLAPIPRVKKRKGLTWKLTLWDKSRDGFALGQVRREGDTLVIPYQNAAAYDPSPAPNERVSALVRLIDPGITIHDFRMVPGPTHTKLIFDAEVPYQCSLPDQEVRRRIQEGVPTLDGRWSAVAEVEKSYI